MKNIISLPINNIIFEESDKITGLYGTILKICKDGYVASHNLYIDKEAIESAWDTIKNKPILCAYEVDEEGDKIDFKGHEIDYKVKQDKTGYTIETIYIEQPVGVIPETNNARWEGDFFTVDAFLYDIYCSDAIKILQDSDGEKSVSMEIDVLESYEDKDKVTHIKNFVFNGVSILGKNHSPAISGANIQTFSQSDTFALQFSEMVKRVNIIANKGGEKVDERQEIIKKFEALKGNEQFETIVANTEIDEVELEKQLFALSNSQICKAVREAVNSFEVEITNRWNESYNMQKYYVEDIITEEGIAICEDNQNYYAYYGVPYTMQGDKAVLDFENAKRYIKGDWREYQGDVAEITVNPMFSTEMEMVNKNFESEIEKVKATFDVNETEEYKNLKAEMFELTNSYATLEGETVQLREFKADFEGKQREKAENEVFEKYSDLKEVEGYVTIVENKANFSLEDVERELKVLAFDNGIVLGSKKKFSKTEKSTIKIPVGEINDDVVSPYGGLLDKYLSK